MDYTHLIENGTYSEDMLDEKSRCFVDGMKEAKELLEAHRFNALAPVDGEGETVLERISAEEQDRALVGAIEMLESAIAQAIVELIDNNGNEGE